MQGRIDMDMLHSFRYITVRNLRRTPVYAAIMFPDWPLIFLQSIGVHAMNKEPPIIHYVTHKLALPCHICGQSATISRIMRQESGTWILLPLCARHRPPDANGPRED